MRLLRRVKALQDFVETEDGANLLAAYKRAANILKKEKWTGAGDELGDEQGIPQTGEEDPLVLVDDPISRKRSPRWRQGEAGADLPRRRR